jgi:hypothetical protein
MRRVLAAFALLLCLQEPARAGFMFPEENLEVPLPEIAEIQLTYPALDPNQHELGQRTFIEQVLANVNRATAMPRRESRRGDESFYDGMRATIGKTQDVVVQYAAQSVVTRGELIGQTLTFALHVEVARDGDQVHVKISFPASAKARRVKPVLLPAPSLDLERVKDDIRHVAGGLLSARMELTAVVEGDIDVPHAPQGVFANFERLMGRPRTMAGGPASTGLSGEFFYRGQKVSATVQVSVFPYHDGSKVHYRSSVPYFMLPDGSMRGDDAVATLREAIGAMATN